MVFRIAGGLFLIGEGLTMLAVLPIPVLLLGLAALVAGIALLAGY